MKTFEILAPVGGSEQLKAAVRCGANAVYLGAGNFNARRNAENFNFDDLKNAVNYCRLRNIKVYVTLNTIVFDKELDELYNTVKSIALCGADAVIVQDFAAVKAVKEICPEMPLHASTQMAVHNVSGAKFLESMGFSRIVLARELSWDEIKKIRSSVKAELEMFVHGAHCMSASGNCYLSAMLGERSGNRGLCAQGCRLNWQNRHKREYVLSLKDMSCLDSIGELCSIGIDSFKIEGRMKRPEYVAAAVSSLKSAIAGNTYNKEALRSVFSRSGFTDGYLKGKRDISMFGYRSKDDVTAAPTVLKELSELYKNDIHPRKISARLVLKRDTHSVLTFSCDNESATVMGEIPQEPRTAPLSEEIALRNLSKLGDTPFTLTKLDFSNTDQLTLPASAINALRRNAADELCRKLGNKKYKINKVSPEFSQTTKKSHTATRVRLESFSQYSPIFEDCEFVILGIDEILRHRDETELLPVRIAAELPELIYPDAEEKTTEKLHQIKDMGITHGYTGNIGGIKTLLENGFKVHGSHGLNITNTLSAQYYQGTGLEDITLSFELTSQGMKNIGSVIPKGAYAYGYLPLMLMRACPQKGVKGCGECSGISHLTDRKGVSFPLICRNREFTVLHNSVPLYLGDKNLDMLDFKTLYFTTESKEECEKIYKALCKGQAIEGKKTNGLWNRELL